MKPVRFEPKPEWLKVQAPGGPDYARIKRVLSDRDLHTVCEEAQCPNIGECWSGGTATFMVLGDVCTRGCRFCAVDTGDPEGRVEAREPGRLAAAVDAIELEYVVLTMVDRDDLDDGGAGHVARCIRAIKERTPSVLVETLVGDFRGDRDAVETVCEARPDVFAHNVETVRRLQRTVRDARCGYEQSLAVLEHAKSTDASPFTKSSIMLGLGETEDEVVRTMKDLRARGVDFLTLGQYLRPGRRHLPVREFVAPEEFDRYRRLAEAEGFRYVASGPLVRSSYRAGEFYVRSLIEGTLDADRSEDAVAERRNVGGGPGS